MRKQISRRTFLAQTGTMAAAAAMPAFPRAGATANAQPHRPGVGGCGWVVPSFSNRMIPPSRLENIDGWDIARPTLRKWS